MARSRMRSSRRVALAATAALAFSPASCTDSSEPAPASTSPTTSEIRPTPPTAEFDRLTRHAAQALTCMLTSEKTQLVSANDGGLLSIPGLPAALLQARKKLGPEKDIGVWRGSWSESFTPTTGRASIIDVEGYIPPESAYWQQPQLTPGAVQAGVDSMSGTYLSVTIDPDQRDRTSIMEIGYMNSPASEKDPGALKTADIYGTWRPATEEDVKQLGHQLDQALGTLMTQSQITDCSINV